MFKWKVGGFSKDNEYLLHVDEGDWGKDVMSRMDPEGINYVRLIHTEVSVDIFPRNGVILLGDNDEIHLGIAIGGYTYALKDECIASLKELAPLTSAVFSASEGISEDVDRHFMLKYEIVSIFDKATGGWEELDVPIEKEFYIKFVNSSVCVC